MFLNGMTRKKREQINYYESSKTLLTNTNLKAGDILLPLRIMLVGGKFGPAVFEIASLIGKKESIKKCYR